MFSEADRRYNPPETLRARQLLWDVLVTHYANKYGLVGDNHDANALKLTKYGARAADFLRIL